MLWIWVTVAAATFQILRTARQHELRSHLSTAGAGFVRYAYGAPLAIVLSIVVFGVARRPIPTLSWAFVPWIAVAAASQIGATIALLAAFKQRDFAVGTVYAKSEVLIVAGLGAVGLGAALRPVGWIGAILVTLGVMSLAAKGSPRTLLKRSGDPAALFGLAAGAGFALAAVGISAASRSLDATSSFDRAVLTLTVLLAVQTALNGLWFAVTDRPQLVAVARAWRPALWVGVFSLAGSVAWAWAFTLESPAKVRTLGQVEIVLAFVIARFTLGERHTRADIAASAVVVAGVIVVTVFG